MVLLWGSTFIAVKYCLEDWSPLQVVSGRYVFGACLLLPWALKALNSQAAVYKKLMWLLLHLALAGSLLPVGLMTWAQQTMPSSYAGVIASLAPTMTLLMGAVIWAQPTRKLHWVGVFCGTLGVVVLRLATSQPQANLYISEVALCAALLATVFWGLAAQNYRRKLAHLPPLLTTALSFQIMAVLMLLTLLTAALLGHASAQIDSKLLAAQA